jgi:RNA polymerase sigma factor (sigma-70 family)
LEPTTDYTEAQLLSLLKTGDENAFTRIYKLYWEKLYFIAHKRLQSAEDSKEIVQNVFFTLWQKREQLDIQHLPLYLAAMIRYAIYRHLGNEKRREVLIRNFGITEEKRTANCFDIDNKQLLDILTQFTNGLQENYRIIFIQHKLMDQPLESVAAQLGVSPRTAERYVEKVMSIMRQHLQKLASYHFFL